MVLACAPVTQEKPVVYLVRLRRMDQNVNIVVEHGHLAIM